MSAMPDRTSSPIAAAGRRDPEAMPTSASRLIAWILGAPMLAIWAWWALSDGAYFATVLLPGAIVLYVLIAITFGFGRVPIAVRGPHAVALAALTGFAAWTAISLAWTPARDLAVDYAQRDFAFAAAFAAGLILAASLRGRALLALLPFLGAGAIVVAVTLIRVRTAGQLGTLIDTSGTLQFPFGYRNANAGFFAMLALGSIPVMIRRSGPIGFRMGAAALAAAALSLVVVSQSRGSVLGVGAGCLVLFLVSRQRLEALIAVLMVAISVAAVSPQLLDPYQAVGGGHELSELQEAMTASVLAAAIAAALTLAYLKLVAPRLSRPSRTATIGAFAAAALVGLIGFTALAGNPIGAIGDGIDKISNGDRSYGQIEGSRFTYAGGLSRLNFWEVALDQAGDDPINGGGAGSFRSTYLTDGSGDYEPRNAHSLPLEVLGELGIVGLLLIATGLVAAVAAALRSRRLGGDSAVLSATALVVAATMLAQAAVDWSWYFGGQTGPMLALLGSAAAPAALAHDQVRIGARLAVATAAGLLALTSIPTFLSARLTNEAAQTWRNDPSAAFSDLDAAASLNPLTDLPLLLKSQIAADSGDDATAIAAARRAISRSPQNWRGHLLAAEALARSDRALAKREAESAAALNPYSPQVKRLVRRLDRKQAG
jgi:O-Antigen ligase